MTRAGRTLGATWLAFVLGACAPELHGSGWYGCTEDACPTSAPFCWSDGLCYTTAEVSRDGSMPVIDGGGLPSPYPSCDPGACAPMDLCLSDPGGGGYCTHRCASAVECPGVDGAQSVCAPDGVCRRGCREDTQCPPSMDCIVGRFRDLTASVCAEDALVTAGPGYHACTGEADCEPPTTCIGGMAGSACLRECTSVALCAENELCQATLLGRSVCLVRCAGAGCPLESTCRFAAGQMLCFPNSWPVMM